MSICKFCGKPTAGEVWATSSPEGDFFCDTCGKRVGGNMNDSTKIFDWDALEGGDVERAVRGNLVMLYMCNDGRPLDLVRVRELNKRLTWGLQRLEEVRNESGI